MATTRKATLVKGRPRKGLDYRTCPNCQRKVTLPCIHCRAVAWTERQSLPDPADRDPRVIGTTPEGHAIVPASGFRRVVLADTGQVIGDLLPPDEAEVMAETYNELAKGEAAVIVGYTDSRRPMTSDDICNVEPISTADHSQLLDDAGIRASNADRWTVTKGGQQC